MSHIVSHLEITALSPVHVGTGRELTRDLDFYVDPPNQVNVVDFDRVVEVCQKAGVDLVPLIEEGTLSSLFSKKHTTLEEDIDPRWAALRKLRREPDQAEVDMTPAISYRSRLASVNPPSSILEQIKNTSFLAYLPGSSIKGAIRTALWWSLLSDENRHTSAVEKLRRELGRYPRERADNAIEDVVMGPDPNRDLGRTIQVGDAGPGVKPTVVESLIADALQRGALGWKNLNTRRIEEDPSHGTSIFCEAISPGERMRTVIRIDEWLFGQEKLGFHEKKETILNLKQVCNAYAESVVEHEIDFYRRYNLPKIASFYENTIKRALHMTDGFLLQMGWGTGWYEKTIVKLFDQALQERIRLRFGLGKMTHRPPCGGDVQLDRNRRGRYFCWKCRTGGLEEEEVLLADPFPKTRKIGFENRRPAYPFGWIKLEEV